ncbi:uncharacterized protein LOC120482199 [Pimephales promelas]|uniref:uncharacterized protein LOC120482199 n=1 Tax=Pimephales promelas TaxID=90988 RepID=UPI0019558E80|nr:uncharacterized protein LOC120482199 [Pimephales promelas]
MQSSSTELSEELTSALAAGRWWAIMEVSDPIPDDYEYDFSVSEEWGDTKEAGATSSSSSLVLSEKAHFLHSGISDETLKTIPEWRQKRTQGAHFSSRSRHEAPVPRVPVSASKVLTYSSHGAPMQKIEPLTCAQAALVIKKISERRNATNPELRRQNSQNAPEAESSVKLRIPKQREKVRDWSERQQRQNNIRKGVSDSAGVDRSASQKKQRMAITVNDLQSVPGGADQMDCFCCLFEKCCVI